ncbi:hypothetical protein NIES4074_25030 [Cylindrospermum sp. NIES-4074]|nr:hypothetical protein NIES4074_25030 [Cylindrospermum sp. NIES-4074]
MKRNLILNVLIGGVTASVLSAVAATSPAQALTWTFDNVQFEDNGTATGFFDFDGISTYSAVNVNVTGSKYGGSTVNFTEADITLKALLGLGFTAEKGGNIFSFSTLSTVLNVGIPLPLNFGTNYGQKSLLNLNISLLKSGSVISSPTQPVPFDLSPNQLATLAVPLFFGMRMLKKKVAAKQALPTANALIS